MPPYTLKLYLSHLAKQAARFHLVFNYHKRNMSPLPAYITFMPSLAISRALRGGEAANGSLFM